MEIRSRKTEIKLPRKHIKFELDNPDIAKKYEVSMLISVREKWRLLDLYAKGNYLILDGPIADHNGIVIPEHETMLNSVADMIENTIRNDVPGFKTKIQTIICDYQREENFELGMADVLDQALKKETKMRFMFHSDMWLYAKVIRRAIDDGPYKTADDLDRVVNEIFDNQNLMGEFIKGINDRKNS